MKRIMRENLLRHGFVHQTLRMRRRFAEYHILYTDLIVRIKKTYINKPQDNKKPTGLNGELSIIQRLYIDRVKRAHLCISTAPS